MIKFILRKTMFILVLTNMNIFAQISTTITKPEIQGTDYIITGNEALIASQSIILRPNTWIKAGSSFSAKIDPNAYIPVTLSNENYIFTRTYQKKNIQNIISNSDVIENVVYFDGLGRPMQDIAIKASPNKTDIVTYIDYDNFGRASKNYLPYIPSTGSTASYRTNAESGTNNYYASKYSIDIDSANPNPFFEKRFENSSLNRVINQGSPGKDWAINSNHDTKISYQTNGINEVKLFTVSTAWNQSFGIFETTLGNSNGTTFYAAGQLEKIIIKDENWISGNEHTTEEFKDKDGRIILKKTYGVSTVNDIPVSTAHETYYIYDIYGNLTFVLPPEADGAINSLTLNELCYQYKYDSRNRLIEKKVPGKGWEYTIYDSFDRPILTQDANLRINNKWLFTKYDNFNRPIYTGEYTNTNEVERYKIQALANGTIINESRTISPISMSGINLHYSNIAFPKTGINLFTIVYYDSYQNIELDGGTSSISYNITPITNAKGLVTCTSVRVLDSNPIKWITKVNYYDIQGKLIYNYTKNNFLSFVNSIKSKFDLSGKVLETTSIHKKQNKPDITIVDTFDYDHMGRIVSQKQKINNQIQETIYSNTYDDLGKLAEKSVGGGIQTINYNYNIRGWLKNINDVNNIGSDLFAFKINYNENTNPLKRLYNGNISQTFWKTAHISTSTRSYSYSYDALNRLTAANDNLNRYDESMSYNKNGNLTRLIRKGNTILNTPNYGTIDDLVYKYNGNKLTSVQDLSGNSQGFIDGSNTTQEYGYDGNANMETDANKGINTKITFNFLNLPKLITLSSATINYDYDATGLKQRKIAGGITTEYANGFQYENDQLQFFPHPEGYIFNNSGNYEYIYQYKDHLGNIRLSYNKNLNIIEENNYYPFGLIQNSHDNIASNGGNATAQKYKYNGKELQDENFGGQQLNLYDYGARNYDPALGRWINLDPLAESAKGWSPYRYGFNNPVSFIDPTGLLETDFLDVFTGDLTHIEDGKDQVIAATTSEIKNAEKNFKTNRAQYDKDLARKESSRANLHLTRSQFMFFAETLYAESSGGFGESLGIVNVLKNRAKSEKTSILDQLSDEIPYGVYGVQKTSGGTNKDYEYAYQNETGYGVEKKKANIHRAIAAGLISNVDVSNGAYFWDGTDIKTNHHYTKWGLTFSNPAHNLWDLKETSGRAQLKTTRALEKTTFTKYENQGNKWSISK